MKTNQNLMNEFLIEELETRFEMKPWVIVTMCEIDPDQCPK